jgi:hypothetical protein
VGHEDKDFHALYIMREHTTYMYKIQDENVATEGGGKIIFQEDLIKETKEDLVRGKVE